MSWKSHVTATFALTLTAAVLGCDDDPTNPEPEPEPISIAGAYDWTFDVSNDESGDDEVGCTAQGMATITQPTDSTFEAGAAGNGGSIECIFFGDPHQATIDEFAVGGKLNDADVTFQFPLPSVPEACEAVGEVEGDPVTGLSGTATCTVNPAVLGGEGDPITLTGTWQAERTD